MPINFEKIPSIVELDLNPTPKTRTVLEELNARQCLLRERTIKCDSIRPFYAKIRRPPHQYMYRYFCTCPSIKNEYECKHTGNIVIDRDVLTPEEHIICLSRPKPNFAPPRKMPRYFLKRSIVANCTAGINSLAKPGMRHVTDVLNNFNSIISRRHRRSLEKYLEKTPNVEYTTIRSAVELMREEKRLEKVAKRKERLRCLKLSRKIQKKQKCQIRKIVCILFEELREFLLNDQFVHEPSPLGEVVLEAIKEFTDKEFHMTHNLREYQKILAYNMAIWINKFLANLNIHVAESPPRDAPPPLDVMDKPDKEYTTFLPLDDYILQRDMKNIVPRKQKYEAEMEEESERGYEEDSSLLLSQVSILCSKMQVCDMNPDQLQSSPNLTVDEILFKSSSTDDVYETAESIVPKCK